MRLTMNALLLVLAVSGWNYVSAQDYDWLDEDLPEFVEDFGYEDADYDGPDLGAASVREHRSDGSPACDGLACDESACDGLHSCRKRESLCHRSLLLGDCLGCRSRFQESGIMYRGRVTQYFFGVGGGVDQALVPPQFSALGIEGGDQFEYTGNSLHGFLIDLEKFGGCPHSKFIVKLENIWGRFGNVSLETGANSPPIFNTFMPVDLEANGVPRLTEFLLVQPLSERLIVMAGKSRLAGVGDQNIFAGGDGSDQFLNQTFVGNPLFVGQLPLTTFAVTAVMPCEWGNCAISVIDPVDRSTEFLDLGDIFSEGMLMFGQVKVKTNFFCKPGEHHIGGLYKNVDLLDLRFTPVPPTYPYPPAPPGAPAFATKDDSYTIFYGFDQYLRVYGKGNGGPRGHAEGWGIFGRAGIADGGNGNPNFKGWHVSSGIGGDSPLRHRRGKGDRFGIGYGFTGTSTAWGPIPIGLFGPRDSQVFEAYYRYMITPAISISPDLQWVKGQLGGLTGGDDAFVGGLRVNMRL